MVRNRKDEKGLCRNLELVSSIVISSLLLTRYSRTCNGSCYDTIISLIFSLTPLTTKLELEVEQVSTELIRWNSTKSKFATLHEITMRARAICYTSLRFPNIPVSLSHCVIRHVSASMLPIKARTWLAHARSRDRKKRDIGGQQEPNIPGSFSELVCTSCIS